MVEMRCSACGQENPEGFGFCGKCGSALTVAEPPREVRKVVTVVFCDLTGSTALGATTDPEALRSTMRSYYEEMRTILERHGGTVEKFIGDAVMAVFGVPVSHEDDALRAVRAAWEMRAAVPDLGLTARIGVNTGEVVTGEGDTLVTGDAVNVAARLEQAAAPGEVLIGVETRHLVRGAVRVEPVVLDAKGKGELSAFRLADVDPSADAFARRLDIPIVGREGELEHLRQAFERTVRERQCHLFTLLGPAGVGKSRLVTEFLASVDARVIEGRCLDYGEGITYWPVVNVLTQLGEQGRVALRFVTDGGQLPNEIPWAVRTAFEQVAAERPLIVLFDDVQWGEETFLDLIDHIADLSRGAPLLLLCVARPELLDKRSGWGGGKLNATTLLLEPLTADECAKLIGLHGGVDDGVRARILETADGNPLFVEEMVALVRENGDAGIPSTVQALLQARIDQLAVDERSVIERGAVEGQIFHRGAVAELARPAEVDPQLIGLVRKDLIHPTPATLAGDQAFRFRHLLIRDAAYDALPKATRADLHERFADWLEEHGTALIELDEITGYHLEQSAGYHRELGHARPDLETRAGERLSAAGSRATARDDMPGALKLFTRAVDLLPTDSPAWRGAFLDRLSLQMSAGDEGVESALRTLEAMDDERLNMDARVIRLHLALDAATSDSSEARAVMEEATRLFTDLDDDRGLASVAELESKLAWLRSQAMETIEANDRYTEHARRAGVADFIGRSTITRFGPYAMGPFTPDQMRAGVGDLPLDAHPRVVIEAMIAEREGRLEDAVALTEWVTGHVLELGLIPMSTAPRSALAKLLFKMGRLDEAAATYREVIDLHTTFGQAGYLSTTLIDYAEVVHALGDPDEAERLAAEGEQVGGPEDIVNFTKGRAVRAAIAAGRGDDATALELAESSVEYAFRTDFIDEHGSSLETLADVHRSAGRRDEARAAYEQAAEIWERYGWSANAKRVRELLVEL
jgi:class 3 adenylate cyclase/tetratricopeptide (TPR) repeat protein